MKIVSHYSNVHGRPGLSFISPFFHAHCKYLLENQKQIHDDDMH